MSERTEESTNRELDIIMGNREIPQAIQKVETTPQTFIAQAIQQGLSIEHLEKLMNLQERWEANQARKLFFESLANFQKNCPILEKTKRVNYVTKSGSKTDYKYAPLGEITSTLQNVLSQNGLSFRWEIDDKSDMINCTCIISHVAGHSERTSMGARKDESGGKNEIQSRGSTITYLQRYTLIAALGIATADEDIDGQDSHKTDVKAEPQAKKAEPQPVQNKEVKPNEPTKVNPETLIKDCKTMVALSNVWTKLSKADKTKYESVKNEVKENIRLSILAEPLTMQSSIFEIEEKFNSIKTRDELNTFARNNQAVLDEMNDPQVNEKFQKLINSLQ